MRRRAAGFSFLSGLVLIALAQLVAPIGSPPVYDGVVIQEPYRYLSPGPGQAGSPSSFQSSPTLEGTTSPPFSAATTESPPQAQLIAPAGAFVVPAGTTAFAVAVEPVVPSAAPSSGQIDGNVYRFSVTDQTGAAVAVNADSPATLILRAADGTSAATIARLDGGIWQDVPTQLAGQPGIFVANVTELGVFAVVTASTGPLGLDLGLVLAAGGAALLSMIVLGFLIFPRKQRGVVRSGSSSARGPLPLKRSRGGRRRGGSR